MPLNCHLICLHNRAWVAIIAIPCIEIVWSPLDGAGVPLVAARAVLATAREVAAVGAALDCFRCHEGSFRSFFLMAWCANEMRVMGRMN